MLLVITDDTMADIPIFERKNPFIRDIALDPWEPDIYDVASVHADASQRLYSLIAEKIESPTKDIGILCTGDIGAGKSHLSWRICQETKVTGSKIFFAAVSPHIETKTPLQYLITEIVRNFSNEIDDFSGCTQFQRLVACIMQEFLISKQTPDKLFQKKKSGESIVSSNTDKAITWLKNQDIKLNKKAIQFLFQCCETNEQALNPTTESAAQEYILTFGTIIARYHHTLLICFDQLESIKDHEIKPFEQIILTIMGFTQGILPFALVRSVDWVNLSKKLDLSVVQRFSNEITLTPCSDADITAIIKTRLHTADTGLKEKEAWLEAEVKKALPKHPSPRQIITTTRAIIDLVAAPQDISDIVSKIVEYLNRTKKRYATIQRCKTDLKISDIDISILEPALAKSGIVVRKLRQWTCFVLLPFEDTICGYVQEHPRKSLRYVGSWLPMTKEEYSEIVTDLYAHQKIAFEFSSASKTPTLLVHLTSPQSIKKSSEIKAHITKLQEMIHSAPKTDVLQLITELFPKKEERSDIVNFCLQHHEILVRVFVGTKGIEFTFWRET